jgi:hypothetical protein
MLAIDEPIHLAALSPLCILEAKVLGFHAATCQMMGEVPGCQAVWRLGECKYDTGSTCPAAGGQVLGQDCQGVTILLTST